jgi:uncharacterized protein YkwD
MALGGWLASGCAGPRPAAAPPGAGPSAPAHAQQGTPPFDPSARYGTEPAVTLTRVEADALDAIRGHLGGAGARLRLSGSLVSAARVLARRNAAAGTAVAELSQLRAALAQGLSYDPAPTQFAAEGDAANVRASLPALVAGAGGATHLGVGAVEAGGTVHVVVLAAVRRARLEPFPRDVPPGATLTLSGALAPGLHGARVVVTTPSGAVIEAETQGEGAAFQAPLRFPEQGPYLVEVVSQGADGPAIAALLAVRAGAGTLTAPAIGEGGAAASASDPEGQVLAALNALRARRGLPALRRSPGLDQVARRHSEDMRRAGRIAHVLPGGAGPSERVAAARIAFREVRENVARGESALAAHAAAAESPAHLENILAPGISEVGLGVSQDSAGAYLTELFAAPVVQDDGPLTLDARVREALWRERARRKLPPLTADPFLDAIARQGAADLRDRDADPRARPDLAGDALRRRRLAADDVYVATSPEEAARSANLPDPRYRRVGVGVVQASSRRFGPGRLFIAVVYSD